MKTICGACCDKCDFQKNCAGCEATCGKPFGGDCVAAEYIRAGGKQRYDEFKTVLRGEIDSLLKANDLPGTDYLAELPGWFVNLAYPLPSGEAVKLLDDKKVYLGAQIGLADTDRCAGVIADTSFIIICTYGGNGSDPELIEYHKR